MDLWNKLKNKISPPHPSPNKNIKNKKAFTNLDLYHTTYCISLFTYLKSVNSCFTDYVLSHCMFISFQDHSSIYNYLLFFLNSQDPKHFALSFFNKAVPTFNRSFFTYRPNWYILYPYNVLEGSTWQNKYLQ